MAQSLRVEFPDAVYHISSRVNAGQPIYMTVGDRQLFLDVLYHEVGPHHW